MHRQRVSVPLEDLIDIVNQGGWVTPTRKIHRGRVPPSNIVDFASIGIRHLSVKPGNQQTREVYLDLYIGKRSVEIRPINEIFYHSDKPWIIYVCRVNLVPRAHRKGYSRHMQTLVELHHPEQRCDHEAQRVQKIEQEAAANYLRRLEEAEHDAQQAILTFLDNATREFVGKTVSGFRVVPDADRNKKWLVITFADHPRRIEVPFHVITPRKC